MPRLPESEIPERLARAPGWTRHGDEIRRTWKFDSFAAAIAFVNRIAELAEAADHHPQIRIDYRTVELRLSTHSEGGLTAKDFALAGNIDP